MRLKRRKLRLSLANVLADFEMNNMGGSLRSQFPGRALTYPHGQRPVTGENRWLRFLYQGHGG